MVKIIIIRVAGTTCDHEVAWACSLAGAKSDLVHLSRIIEGTVCLRDYDALFFPGGFSYGDDLGAGKVFANEIALKIKDQLLDFSARKRPIIGISNGFQALVKSGLLPFTGKSRASLIGNDSGSFESRWLHLRVESSVSPFFRNFPERIRLPIAHAEGKFLLKNSRDLECLEKGSQILLRYISPSGALPEYPDNPDGSLADIAGVCDHTGLIVGMMPHPERALLHLHLPDWRRNPSSERFGLGYRFFRNVVEYCS
ncbi:MAG: phosphoribosylformylglycinamidine synthase I [Candidatus Ratteibacteria bacterium]